MKTIRVLPCVLVGILAIGLNLGCSRGPTEEELKFAELQAQFTTIQEQFDHLQEVRAELAAKRAAVSEIEAEDERKLSDEQKALLEDSLAEIEALSSQEEEAFEQVEGNLAEFLNVALNDFPEAEETQKALDIYSMEAIIVAEDMVTKAGDYAKAIDHLGAVGSLYDQVGLDAYPGIDEKIAWLNSWRFITQERFDEVKKGMTKDEVKVLAGVPYYQNIQKDEKRGVETWLYRKEDGGAAAIYFKMKTGKVYNKNYDAIKTKVVEE